MFNKEVNNMSILKINKQYEFSKVGMNEVEGLAASMKQAFTPVVDFIKDKTYWNDNLDSEPAEYTSRDGFIPHSHNCGGYRVGSVIPKCEEYDWSFLEFGKCDPEFCSCHTDTNNGECELDIDGHNDSVFKVWLKFEGINTGGVMEFYLVASGSNTDSPYFRERYQPVLFESSFQAKTLKQFESKAKSEIKKMLKKFK